MSQDDRAAWDLALQRARRAAYAPGEYVGQESFVTAGQIAELAGRAGIGPSVSVLDLCCGVAGPGRFIATELGCAYLGVDECPGAVALARDRAPDAACRFEVASVPPCPTGPFDVVLLLEAMLAFADKGPLLRAVGSALTPGGRFALTVEEGEPLTAAERAAMPAADTVWPIPLEELVDGLGRVGLQVVSTQDLTEDHSRTAQALGDAYADDRRTIADRLGQRAVDDLVTSHRLWSDWLREGRVRKLAMVARKAA